MKKLISILLIFTLVFTFAACKKEEPIPQIDFGTWFKDELIPTYDAFVKTSSGKNVPVISIEDMIISLNYINSVFDYIAYDKVQPNGGAITEANGVYTYKGETLVQTVEFDNNTCSVRISSSMVINGESKPQFTVTMREKDDVFYIQYLASEFRTYYEISFTATSGSVKTTSRMDLPYSIFAAEIPENFAKEN